MWWWILAAVVVGVLVVGWLVVRRKRPVSRRPPGRPGPAKTKTTGKNLTPGDIWWADVPYEDGSGSKVRPCLVLRPAGRSVDVLKITSQDQSRRRDHVEIPTRHWDPRATHNSHLDLTDPIRVRRKAFTKRAGRLDAATWTKVRKLHRS